MVVARCVTPTQEEQSPRKRKQPSSSGTSSNSDNNGDDSSNQEEAVPLADRRVRARPPEDDPAASWREPDAQHRTIRRVVIRYVVKELEIKISEKGPEAEDVPMASLLEMARHLELLLYRRADTLEEYQERSTVRDRLQQLADDIRTSGQVNGTHVIFNNDTV